MGISAFMCSFTKDYSSLRATLERTKPLIDVISGNTRYFHDTYYRPKDSTQDSIYKAYLEVITHFESTKTAVKDLKTRLINHHSNTKLIYDANKRSIIGRVKNIWVWMKLQGFELLLTKLNASQDLFDNQYIMPYSYNTKEDCMRLITILFGSDLPEINEIAEFIKDKGIALKFEGKPTGKEEIMQINNALVEYLSPKPGYGVVARKCDLPLSVTGLCLIDKPLITKAALRQAFTRFTNIERVSSNQLESLQLSRYLTLDDEADLRTYLEKNLYLEKDTDINTPGNREAVAETINNYFGVKHLRSGTIDAFFQSPGKFLALFIMIRDSRHFHDSPWDECRIHKLLANCYLESNSPASIALAEYIQENSTLNIKHYAYLSLPEEVHQLNLLIIDFLKAKSFASPLEREIIQQMDEKYGRQGSPLFTFEDLRQSYDSLLSSQRCPNLLERVTSLAWSIFTIAREAL